MNRFAFLEMEEVVGKIKFFKLSIDGDIEYDEFENTCKANPKDMDSLVGILRYMNRKSNLEKVPPGKYKSLDNKGENLKTFEFKKDNLRVYGMTRPGGKIIVFGAKKGTQNKDIKRIKSIAKEIIKRNLEP